MITCNCNTGLPANPADGDGIEWDDDAYGPGQGGWVAAPALKASDIFRGPLQSDEILVFDVDTSDPNPANWKSQATHSQIKVQMENPNASGIAFNLLIPDPQTNPTVNIDLSALGGGPHAPTHAVGGADPLTPASIGAAAATHGNTHTHYGGDPALVAGLYRRDFRTSPGLIPANVTVDAISFWFADSDPNDNITDYADAIVLASWGDASGGKINMLTMQKKNGSTIRHYQGDVGGATWTLIGELEYKGHASAHALGGSDPLTPAAIGAAATIHDHADKADALGGTSYYDLSGVFGLVAGMYEQVTDPWYSVLHWPAHSAMPSCDLRISQYVDAVEFRINNGNWRKLTEESGWLQLPMYIAAQGEVWANRAGDIVHMEFVNAIRTYGGTGIVITNAYPQFLPATNRKFYTDNGYPVEIRNINGSLTVSCNDPVDHYFNISVTYRAA